MMETQNRNWSKKQYSDFSYWKETCYFNYIERLWCSYSGGKPVISFIEYVRQNNHYKSLVTAIALIEKWERVKNQRINRNINSTTMMLHISWVKQFKESSEYSHLRFKKLNQGFNGYPPFNFDDIPIDAVDLETFIRIEEKRIPLFIGTQFGLYPWFYEFPDFYNGDKIIAILGKSVLTGHVAGLGLYKVDAHSNHSSYTKEQEIIYFKNA